MGNLYMLINGHIFGYSVTFIWSEIFGIILKIYFFFKGDFNDYIFIRGSTFWCIQIVIYYLGANMIFSNILFMAQIMAMLFWKRNWIF